MPETSVDQPAAPRGPGSRLSWALVILLLMLAAIAAATWYGWQSGALRLILPINVAAPLLSPASQPSQAVAAVVANAAATNAALTSAAAKLSALEQRLAELNQQAAAASGQASHAEALLVAFAARRAIERGQPLGYLEAQLRVRFGDGQPNAVNQVIAAAQRPMTVPILSEQLGRLEPQLIGGSANEGGWEWLNRQMGELFVIRRDSTASPAPESRIQRAREAISGGRITAAIAEVERMPGKDAAADWLARARELVVTQRALDQLESASLSFPLTPQIVAPVPTPQPSAPAKAQ